MSCFTQIKRHVFSAGNVFFFMVTILPENTESNMFPDGSRGHPAVQESGEVVCTTEFQPLPVCSPSGTGFYRC
jgi:hypothetical protein